MDSTQGEVADIVKVSPSHGSEPVTKVSADSELTMCASHVLRVVQIQAVIGGLCSQGSDCPWASPPQMGRTLANSAPRHEPALCQATNRWKPPIQ